MRGAAPEATVLRSVLDPRSEEYRTGREAMLASLADVRAVWARVLAAGGEAYVARHRGRGKLLARERVELLVDPDGPFLELSALAGAHAVDPVGDREAAGGALITGIGPVSGVECVVIANEPTIKGGAVSPTTVAKQLRALEIAERNRLPVVTLVESAGADLPRQAEIFVPGGRIFRELSRLSAGGIPTVSLVFGSPPPAAPTCPA